MNRYSLYLLFLLFLFSSHLLNAQENQKGILWQIDKPGVSPSYLLGTIHSDDPRVIHLPPLIEKCFTQAKSVTIEMEINMTNVIKSLLKMYLDSEHTLDKLISQQEYEMLVNLLREYGVPEEASKRLKPLATMIILSKPQSQGDEFLDFLLYHRAKEMKKPVYGLETAEEQLALLDVLSIPEQAILLKESLQDIGKLPTIFEKLHELYLQRDLSALLSLSEEYMKSEKNEALVEKFRKALIDDRNIRMVNRMQTRLKEGNAFIAVGALHLPGKEGILNLLEIQGYQIVSLY